MKMLLANDCCGSIKAFGFLDHQVSVNNRDFFSNPKEYSLVVFTGGEDVAPVFYGEESPHGMCRCNFRRDMIEDAIFKKAVEEKIPMAGICRGLQILNVFAGGKLVHHMTGHAGIVHSVKSSAFSGDFNVNSFHHQCCIPKSDTNIIAVASPRRSDTYYGDRDEEIDGHVLEVEAMYFPEIDAAGVQWHPEWLSETTNGHIFFKMLVMDLLSKPKEYLINKYMDRT